MKIVVRENINELFQKDSDPISDMNIGGIVLRPEFEKKYKQFMDEWHEYLKQYKFIGKKIKGEFIKNSLNGSYKQYIFTVKEVSFWFKEKPFFEKTSDIIEISPAIIFTSEEDNYYYNDGNHKFYIIG